MGKINNKIKLKKPMPRKFSFKQK